MTIDIHTEYIKLDQLLKFAGIVGSGGDAKLIIQNEIVLLNGEQVKERGKKIRSGDVVIIGEQEIYVRWRNIP